MPEEHRSPDRRLPKPPGSGLQPTASPAPGRLSSDFLHPASAPGAGPAGRSPRRGARLTASLLAALGLAAAVAILPAPADAACGKSERVSHRDAECLNAWRENKGAFTKNKFHVRNMCPAYGRVVAKVDLKDAMDRTLHLATGTGGTAPPATGSARSPAARIPATCATGRTWSPTPDAGPASWVSARPPARAAPRASPPPPARPTGATAAPSPPVACTACRTGGGTCPTGRPASTCRGPSSATFTTATDT